MVDPDVYDESEQDLDKRRRQLERAPHGEDCEVRKPGVHWKECTCWKRDAWARLHAEEQRRRAR